MRCCACSARAGWRSCTSRASPTSSALVALKELRALHADDPALRAALPARGAAGRLAHHPNVVTVYEYFEHDGMPYMAMEYLERGSLRPSSAG